MAQRTLRANEPKDENPDGLGTNKLRSCPKSFAGLLEKKTGCGYSVSIDKISLANGHCAPVSRDCRYLEMYGGLVVEDVPQMTE